MPTPRSVAVAAGLVRASFLVNAVYAATAREHGLTPQEVQLLCVLMAKSDGTRDLGIAVELAATGVTGLVERGECHGLVQRERHPCDAESVRLALTPAGRLLAEQFYTECCERLDDLAAGLVGAERDTFAALLDRMALEHEVPEVAPMPS